MHHVDCNLATIKTSMVNERQYCAAHTSIYGQALGLKDQELSALEVKKIVDARSSTNRDGRYGRRRSNEGASRC
jgi:hypothetical protein